MRYLPHTDDEIKQMLKAIGAKDLDDLFSSIDNKLRLNKNLDLPKALSEIELREDLASLANQNHSADSHVSFLGGGAYHHTVPAIVSQLISRGEFLTAYTPYQPEVSQGTLQALFEYQTMMCEITGMEIANGSNYDASTGCAEALLMATRLNKKKKALIAKTIHPQYRKVMKTYLARFGYELVEVNYQKDGTLDLDDFKSKHTDDVGAVMVQSPNFFGVIEDLAGIGLEAKTKDSVYITVASEPLSYALLKTPGEVDADIAVLEGMSFGVGLNFGGPYLGVFATKQKYIRSMPGRVVGETVDQESQRGYVLTFATREQHIRREKATSNICTNQGLCTLMATIYLAAMGKQGLIELAQLNLNKANYAKKALSQIEGVSVLFDGPTFNEFVISVPNSKEVYQKLAEQNIQAGILVDRYYDELTDALLVCVTEMNSKQDIDLLVKELTKAL